jgi:hypothetical protein
MRRELEHLDTRPSTTWDTTQEIIFMRDEFWEGYNHFKVERDIFMAQVVGYQEGDSARDDSTQRYVEMV